MTGLQEQLYYSSIYRVQTYYRTMASIITHEKRLRTTPWTNEAPVLFSCQSLAPLPAPLYSHLRHNTQPGSQPPLAPHPLDVFIYTHLRREALCSRLVGCCSVLETDIV